VRRLESVRQPVKNLESYYALARLLASFFAFIVIPGYEGHVEGQVVESKEQKNGVL
jgi:hypothetical protein